MMTEKWAGNLAALIFLPWKNAGAVLRSIPVR
jgi:hypothetical protein